jgi:hypothetical protein
LSITSAWYVVFSPTPSVSFWWMNKYLCHTKWEGWAHDECPPPPSLLPYHRNLNSSVHSRWFRGQVSVPLVLHLELEDLPLLSQHWKDVDWGLLVAFFPAMWRRIAWGGGGKANNRKIRTSDGVFGL